MKPFHWVHQRERGEREKERGSSPRQERKQRRDGEKGNEKGGGESEKERKPLVCICRASRGGSLVDVVVVVRSVNKEE
jgi:ligand-binding sensor protein